MKTVDTPIVLALGMGAVFAGLMTLIVLLTQPRRTVARERRRPGSKDQSDAALARFTDAAVGAINRSLHGRELRLVRSDKLEQAGLRMSRGDFLFMCGGGALLAAILGFVLAGPGLGILLLLLVPGGMLIWLNIKAARRQAKFATQLPDTLQMLAGSMRAGHSLLRALDAASQECEEPMGAELSRALNEARIGRDLVESLVDLAGRMKSQDFLWTTQAIETQREVGGNLAEILENVNDTIRDRAQLARQVSALSAEGKLSAYILIGLPIAFLVILSFINPLYSRVFYTTLPGWGMLAVCAILLGVGSLWLFRMIKPKY
ncbi:tight adherence protein B [Sinomonas sp. RB5]